MLFKNDSAMVRELADRGFRVDAKSGQIVSLLEYWIREGDRKWVDFLLNFEINFKLVRLFTTDESMIDFLLQKGALEEQINPRMVLEDDRRDYLLQKYRIDLSKLDCFDVELLLIPKGDLGVDLERAKMLSQYDLDRNCFVNRRIINYILDKRFPRKVKFENEDSYQEAWLAFYQEKGIKWSFCDETDKNPLMKAIKDQDLELVKLLTKYGADPLDTCSRFDKSYNALDFARKEISNLEGMKGEVWQNQRNELNEIIKVLEN